MVDLQRNGRIKNNAWLEAKYTQRPFDGDMV
jgi:hypothetical protein